MSINRLFRKLGSGRTGRVSLWHALLAGAIPTIVLILLTPLNLPEYDAELEFRYIERKYWYDDLESDGKKEELAIGLNPDSSLSLLIYDDQNSFLGQFNFSYPAAKIRNERLPGSNDINGDGIREIILFTQHNDSLFINAFDYRQLKPVLEARFIVSLGGFNRKKDFTYNFLGWFDANGDGIEELYFSVAASFALFPRQVFRYDFVQDSLLSSINTGASYLVGEIIHMDEGFRLIVTSSATSNIPESYPYPYHDTTCWVFCFDQNLELIAPPLAIGSYPSQTNSVINISGRAFFNVEFFGDGMERTILFELDSRGRIIDSLFIPGEVLGNILPFPGKDTIILGFPRKNVERVISFGIQPLSKRPERREKMLKDRIPRLIEDLDKDGKPETFMMDRRTYAHYFFPGYQFNNGLEIMPVLLRDKLLTARYRPGTREFNVALASKYESEVYSIFKNPAYSFRYLIWLAIYLAVVCFLYGIMVWQRRRIERQLRLEQQVADLQLQNLRNQLDPHFTFNALNSVGSAIYQENKEKAYDLFQRFTRMIRSSLMVSQQLFRPLSEEIQFTRDYLEFQKTRFPDRFDFDIKIGADIDQQSVQIPKMLIQGFAENAVKHAFHGITYTGEIRISIFEIAGAIQILIQDNGIGINRSRSEGFTSGTRKGEQLTRDQVRQINRLYHKNIRLNIRDTGGEAELKGGTSVEIFLS